ncbi:MAG: hypothetical protein IT388_07865 [Nitrospirales bacterium]|nr:hypothetical protein [Nitrospirales bacterium]
MMFDELLTLEDIKREPFIVENIRWDVEPRDLMEPRHIRTEAGTEVKPPIKGYIFYIDVTDAKPALFLLRHTTADYAETLAQIKEIPAELLSEAVEENRGRLYFNMSPINGKVEVWLKEQFGIRGQGVQGGLRPGD